MHKILRVLILSDLFILGSFGLVQPIFAVFMLKGIVGTTITAIGIATAIHLITKSLLQIFVSKWTDAEPGNKRELLTLLIGSLIMSAIPFGFIFSFSLTHIYLLQFLYGLGAALAFPGWMVIYSRYTRQDKAGYEWSVYNTIINLGLSGTAVIGAYLADFYSFNILFILVGISSLMGTALIVSIFRNEFTRQYRDKLTK